MKIAHHVRGRVKFDFYRAGNLYYATDTGLVFPVPVEEADHNSATFLADDKALYYMRWIRKHLETLEDASLHGEPSQQPSGSAGQEQPAPGEVVR